jgi:hypothetical protein
MTPDPVIPHWLLCCLRRCPMSQPSSILARRPMSSDIYSKLGRWRQPGRTLTSEQFSLS